MDHTTRLEQAHRLLDRIAVFRSPCDLDLLIFFVRHPRTLMASEQLAAFLGYNLPQIAESLDVLLGAELLTRTQHPSHAARMYVLVAGGSAGGWLPALLDLASTREGRLALRLALTSSSAGAANHRAGGGELEVALPAGSRPYLVRQEPSPVEEKDAAGARRKGGR